jgi:uncharacterized protein (DUF2147 family)
MRKTLVMVLAMAVCLLGASVALAGTAGVLGCWKTVDEKTNKVKSTVCFTVDKKGIMSGKITKLHNPSKPNPKCDKCPGALKGKPILGLTIVWGMKKGDDRWEGGRIMDPEKGKTYRCAIWREGKVLKVRGYVFVFHRTQTWVK